MASFVITKPIAGRKDVIDQQELRKIISVYFQTLSPAAQAQNCEISFMSSEPSSPAHQILLLAPRVSAELLFIDISLNTF